EVASRVTPKKPILALKTGRTSEGVAAVASHTGSLIEQDTLADAIFEKSGVMRFHSQQDMIEAAIALSTQPVPKSENIVIVTNTGGPAIIAVDECIAAGLKLAKLSPETGKALGELLFSEAIVSNPVDVVATAGAKEYGGTVDILLKDPNIDSLILNFVTPPFVDCEEVAHRLAEIGKTADKPIICIILTIEEKFGEVVRLTRESGIPVFDFPESASRALAAMIKYGQIQKREKPAYVTHETDKAGAETIIKRYRGQDKFLPQADVFELLQCYGIPTATTVRVKTKEELKKQAGKLNYPVALKVDAEEIVHKSDAGGVALGLKDEAALLETFDGMSEKFKKHKPAFVVQEHLSEGREVIVGAKGNEDLGPTLMFGLGGVFVETLKDVQFRLAPLSQQDALAMVRSIKGYPILEGARGAQPADVDAVCEILVKLSQLGSDFPEIDEIDLNPVFVFDKGKGARVVDARLKTRKV
ncbi:MAG: acetate--CoA ligase family protein, partial [Candidatus Zixiibacteriota bacterium]